jgi:hypothetical protein|tara:strand:+ start:1664 stop:1870 length:207 start_codon:yes stop_codon:yes gene_type:complete
MLYQNDKVVVKDMPGEVMTVSNAYPDNRNRISVKTKQGEVYRRSTSSVRKLNRSDITIINAYNGIMRF